MTAWVPAHLHQISPSAYPNSETVASLVRYSWAVNEDASVGSLTEVWKAQAEVPVLGIVAADGTLRGILSTSRFFASLARPYGWEVLNRKPVTELMEPVQTFSGGESLLVLADKLRAGGEFQDQSFFGVVDSQTRFLGLFSQQDLLNYLARSTQRDLATAQALQGQLVKSDWTVDEGSVWARGICTMFKGVGGDFSTLRQVGPGRWFGCVCDVSGKGIAASLVTTLLWGVLESTDPTQPLASLVGRINAAVCKAFQGEKFVSGFFWTYEEATGHLGFADMGHSHESFWAGGALVPGSDTPNLPLGIEEALEVVTGDRWLGPGDGILVYSDGVIENIWKKDSDFPVNQVLADFLAQEPGVPARGLVDCLSQQMGEFRRAYPAHDDVTLVWFQRA